MQIFRPIIFIILITNSINGQIIDQNFCIDRGFGSGLFLHPDPQKCNQFVQCAMFIPIPLVCPVGKIFVADLKSVSPYGSCVFGNIETCEPSTTTTTSPKTTTKNSESSTQSTEIPTAPPTNSPSTTPIPVHRCPSGGNGIIPNYTNCSRYFECINGKRHLRFCDYGLLFDSVTLQCTYPNFAVCAG